MPRSRSLPRLPPHHDDSEEGAPGALGKARDTPSSTTTTAAVPSVPPIPAHFLTTGRPASIAAPSRLLQGASSSPPPAARSSQHQNQQHQRPATSAGEQSTRRRSRSSTNPGSPVLHTFPLPRRRRTIHHERFSLARESDLQRDQLPVFKRSRSQPSTPARQDVDVHRSTTLSQLQTCAPEELKMARPGGNTNQQDYFLELADNDMPAFEDLRPLRRSESRISQAGKRRSLPAEPVATNDRRPSTSGNVYPSGSRLSVNRGSADMQRYFDQYRNHNARNSGPSGDTVSVSGMSASGRTRRFSAAPASPLRAHERPESPEIPRYGRRRPSFAESISAKHPHAQSIARTFDSQEESPTESSEMKQTDSTSNDSQTVDTVWDELDDLKSRIKKLELTGKMPETSSAAVSGETSERPHTATTAPTTVDSSPKRERKRTTEEKTTPAPPSQAQAQPETTTDGSQPPNIHPMLQSALLKAKPLLNVTLFRTLEATANDALQLAALTGSAGPQGTTYSAASIINGVTVSDRHVRRKADTMCRNLTDLCMALCEGKFENPNVMTSPLSTDTMIQDSPSLRHANSDIGRRVSTTRPMSRLEARRTSILGIKPTGNFESVSPRGSVVDSPAPEQDLDLDESRSLQPRRISRAPSSLRGRVQLQDEASGDDDPTIRPPSRARTDVNMLRTRPSRIVTDDRSPGLQRTPSLRESIANRRANESAYENNQETPRIASESRRRRLFDQQSTPPVMEEENSPGEYHTSSQSRRWITSSGQFSGGRRAPADYGRSPSLSQRRQVIVE